MSIAEIPSIATSGLVLGPADRESIHAEVKPARAAEALGLWLRWNEVYERVTATLFDERHDPKQLEQVMDLADELRRNAVCLTRELLSD